MQFIQMFYYILLYNQTDESQIFFKNIPLKPMDLADKVLV